MDFGLWSLVDTCFDGSRMVMVRCAGVGSLTAMGNHRDLQAWRRAHDLAGRIDRESRRVARGHAELADQLRRASLSIPTNLAEGSSRGRDPEFLRYINIAIGSAAEVDSLLAHAALVAALDRRIVAELLEDITIIRKMLFKLRTALQGKGVRLKSGAQRPKPFDHRPAVVRGCRQLTACSQSVADRLWTVVFGRISRPLALCRRSSAGAQVADEVGSADITGSRLLQTQCLCLSTAAPAPPCS